MNVFKSVKTKKYRRSTTNTPKCKLSNACLLSIIKTNKYDNLQLTEGKKKYDYKNPNHKPP